MKIRVVHEFKDKHTGKLHPVGEEMEVTLERVNEILRVGNLIELVELTEQTQEPKQFGDELGDVEPSNGENQEEPPADETKPSKGRRTRKN